MHALSGLMELQGRMIDDAWLPISLCCIFAVANRSIETQATSPRLNQPRIFAVVIM